MMIQKLLQKQRNLLFFIHIKVFCNHSDQQRANQSENAMAYIACMFLPGQLS